MSRIRDHPMVVKLWSDRLLHVFCGNEIGSAPETDLELRINDMAHVERFEPTERWHSRDAFIADCRRRVDSSDKMVVTIADRSGPLLGYVFAQVDARDSYFPDVERRLHWPANTATTFSAYVHPAARGRRLNRMLAVHRNRHLMGERGIKWIASAIKGDNRASLQSNTRAPSKIVADLSIARRFGHVRKAATRRDVHPDFVFEIE